MLGQCNNLGKNFTELVHGKTCASAISSCKVAWNRYDDTMLKRFQNVIIFKYNKLGTVFDRLDSSLPRRVVRLASKDEFVTNKKRHASNEQESKYCSRSTLRKEFPHAWSYCTLCYSLDTSGHVEVRTDRPKLSLVIARAEDAAKAKAKAKAEAAAKAKIEAEVKAKAEAAAKAKAEAAAKAKAEAEVKARIEAEVKARIEAG